MEAVAGLHRATLDLECDSASIARWVVQAIQPELSDAPGGSDVVLGLDGARVRVAISASSLADLRASVNNVVRLLDAANNVAGRVR